MVKGRIDSMKQVPKVRFNDDDDDKGNLLAQLEMDDDIDGAKESDEEDDANRTFGLGNNAEQMLARVSRQFDLARSRRLQNNSMEHYLLNPVKRAMEDPV